MKSKVVTKWEEMIPNPLIQRGFKNRDAVERWAQKHGYSTVYYDERRQTVYLDRAMKAQADARHLERQSEKLLEVAEAQDAAAGG